MRVAIDARTVSGRKTGDRTFTLGILSGLAGLGEEAGGEFVAILRDATGRELIPEQANFTTLVHEGMPGLMWMPFSFPYALRRAKADVAVIQYMGPFWSPCPFVTAIHDVVWRSQPETFPEESRRLLEKFIPGTIRRAKAVITGSEFSRGEILQHFAVPPDKVRVVPYGVDSRFVLVTDEAALDYVRNRYGLRDPFILSLGVLQPRKNVEGLVEAYLRLRPDLAERFSLVIAGKLGWQYEEARTRIEEASRSHNVRAIGYVRDEDLPALYTLATCFAYPSLYEGFGLPPLEAMACGTPVVTANVTSMPEVAGSAAICVDPTSPDAIREGLERVLTNRNLREDLITKGLARAKEFTWTRSASTLMDVLRNL